MAKSVPSSIQKRLQTQLGIPFFILVGFTVGMFVFGTLYFAGKLQGQANQQDAEFIAVSIQEDINTFIERLQGHLAQSLSATEGGEFDAAAQSKLKTILASNSTLLVLSFFDANGTHLFELHKSRTPDAVLNATLRGETYRNAVLQENGAYYVITSTEEGGTGPYLYVALPQKGSDGANRGFLVAAATILDIERSIERPGLNGPANVALVERASAADILGANTLEGVVSGDRPTRENMRSLFDNDKKKYSYVTENGVRIGGAWEEITNTPWVIIAETPGGAVSGNAVTLFIGAGLLLVIFIALVFYYLSEFNRRLLAPLRKIEKGVHYYRTGDYSEEIKLGVKNELANIAGLLNSMAHDIMNNTSERVKQLKKVLERQNTDTRLLIEKDVELREQGVKLQELDKAKSMFVSVAAHQMRTPLAAVKWAIKMVADGDVGPVNPEQKEYLMKGYDSTTRMIDLINDLLDVDKIESDKFSYEFKPEKLTEILQGIVDDLTPIANEKGVQLIFTHAKEDNSDLNADKVKLRNALQNLIDNAIKYTIGGGEVKVTLSIEQDKQKLSISDTGIGIPRSEQGKVFGKFFRAKNAVRQQTDGSGLGLFIVKKIIEKHGGEVTFESKEGKGTTFFITLPVLKKA